MCYIKFESTEQAKEYLIVSFLGSLMSSVYMGFTYWKPFFWWESMGSKLYRNFLGDKIAEVFWYVVLAIFFAASFMMGVNAAIHVIRENTFKKRE